MNKFLWAILFFLCSASLHAADPIRPATRFHFTGYWRVHLIPNEKHRMNIKNEQMGFNDPCQILIHRPDGEWKNISITNMAGAGESKQRCPDSMSEVDNYLAALALSSPAQDLRWKKAPNQDGLFFVSDSATQRTILWKADYVDSDMSTSDRLGFDLKQGDMIMQLTREIEKNQIIPVWPMVLRPVAQ